MDTPFPMTPLGHLRAWARLLMLALVTGVFASYAAIVTAFGMDDVERLRRRGVLFRRWCRTVLRVAGIRLLARGRCPESASLVIANHLSYLDVMVLGAETPMVFVAKSEVASWPVVGPLCAFVGTLFIDRTSRAGLPAVTNSVANLMAAGIRVMVFPEGTTTAGDQLLPFRPALLQPAIDQGAAVACATLLYETPPGSIPAQRRSAGWATRRSRRTSMGSSASPRSTRTSSGRRRAEGEQPPRAGGAGPRRHPARTGSAAESEGPPERGRL